MADICFLVPGTMGSEIHAGVPSIDLQGNIVPTNFPIWIHAGLIAGYGLANLQLDDFANYDTDRVIPGPRTAATIMRSFYGPLQRQLEKRFKVVPYPYDWRKNLKFAGQQLGGLIREKYSKDRLWFVGHSAGGIVMRWAWSQLVSDNLADQVERMVTLGTPHWGSYAIARVWKRQDPVYLNIIAIRRAVVTAQVAAGLYLGVPTYLNIDYPLWSWLGWYHLLPSMLGGGAQNDPARVVMFTASNWLQDGIRLHQHHLDSLAGYWTQLATQLPDAARFAQVIGYGLPSPAKLTGDNLGAENLFKEESGDGTVAEVLARHGGSKVWRVPAAHDKLCLHPAILSDINSLLLDGLANDKTTTGEILR